MLIKIINKIHFRRQFIYENKKNSMKVFNKYSLFNDTIKLALEKISRPLPTLLLNVQSFLCWLAKKESEYEIKSYPLVINKD